jgi:hypothetical protein
LDPLPPDMGCPNRRRSKLARSSPARFGASPGPQNGPTE